MLVSASFISQGNRVAFGRLTGVCIITKEKMKELRIDYIDLSHGYFMDESKITVNFNLTKKSNRFG